MQTMRHKVGGQQRKSGTLAINEDTITIKEHGFYGHIAVFLPVTRTIQPVLSNDQNGCVSPDLQGHVATHSGYGVRRIVTEVSPYLRWSTSSNPAGGVIEALSSHTIKPFGAIQLPAIAPVNAASPIVMP